MQRRAIYTPKIFHLLPRASQTSSSAHKAPKRSDRLPFDLILWYLPPTSMEISMEVNSRPWKFPSIEVDLLPWKLVEASMEVSGSFHCWWKWKLPLLPSIAASTKIFRGSFHERPHTPTHFHLLPRVSQNSGCFHKTNPDPVLTLELPPWKLAYFQLPWKYTEVDGSSCFRESWSYLRGSTWKLSLK